MATIGELLEQQGDECDVSDVTPEEEVCSVSSTGCFPNPMAIVPDWTQVTVKEPYLNEKTCEFEVAIEDYEITTEAYSYVGDDGQTYYVSQEISDPTGIDAKTAEGMANIESDLIKTGLRILIDYYGKNAEEGDDTFSALELATYVKNYEIPLKFGVAVRANPTVTSCGDEESDDTSSTDSASSIFVPTRVLIAIPVFNLDQADTISDIAESSTFEGQKTLNISIFDLKYKLKRLSNAMRIYSLFQGYAQDVFEPDEATKIYYKGTKRNVQIDEFREYVRQFWPALSELARANGYRTNRPGRIFRTNKDISEISIVFNENETIEEVYLYNYGCEDKINVYPNGLGGETFKNDARVTNKVVAGLVGNINDIDDAISARDPMLWYEFVQQYFNLDIDLIEGEYPTDEQSSLGCFLDNLQQDTGVFDALLNQLVSIPDVLANKFAEFACKDGDSDAEMRQTLFDEGENFRTLLKTANEMENFSFDDPFLDNFAELIKDVDNPRELLDKLTACGLIALLLKIMQCLTAQMSWEDTLKAAVKAALKNMKMKHIGKMWGLFPASAQSEVYDIVIERLVEQGIDADSFQWPWEAISASVPGDWEGQASEEESVQAALEAGAITQLEADAQLAEIETYHTTINEAPKIVGWNSLKSGESPAGDTISTRNSLSKSASIASAEILTVLFEAMMEVIGADQLLEYLNSFPGSEIIAGILKKAECINPPKFSTLPDFMKVGDVEFCRANLAITIPRLPEFTFDLPINITVRGLYAMALDALLEAFRNIILTLLSKLIFHFKSNLCDILENLADVATAFDASEGNLLDAINQSVCDAEGEESVGNIFSELGADVTADEATDLVNNLSSVFTSAELCQLLKGTAGDDLYKIAFKIINYNNVEFLAFISNVDSTKSFLISLGNYISQEELNKLCDIATRAGPEFYAGASVCDESEVYDEIQELRRKILECAGIGEAEIQSQLDKINERTAENAEMIMDILQGGGVEEYISSAFPSFSTTGNASCPTTAAIFPKDDPISSMQAADSISELLESVQGQFMDDMIGRKGFFDFVMSVCDGTRLKKQIFMEKNPLLNMAANFRQNMAEDNSDLRQEDGIYPVFIGSDVKSNIGTYASSVVFDSTIEANSVSLQFATEGDDYISNIFYIHSHTSDPAEDYYSIKTTETIDYEQAENDQVDGETDFTGGG